MFRKKLAVLVAAALMSLTASSAFAAFADLELIRVYYDRSGAEIATDLGKVKDIIAAPTSTFAGSFGGLTTGFVSYFALDRTTGVSQLWVSGVVNTPSTIVGGATGLTGLKSGTTNMYSLYNTMGGTNYTGLASATNSYKAKVSASQGTMALAISNASRLNTEASLTSVLAGGSVTQSLYFWNNALTTVAADKIGKSVATITTNADGSTTVTTTPIPAAFYLMGSGLLGLVGLRRRNKVA